MPQIDWTPEGVHLEFRHDEDRPVRLTRFVGQDADACIGDDVPLVEVLAVGLGHTLANDRLVQSSIGAALRYRSHREPAEDTLTLRLATEGITPELEVHIELRAVAGAVRAVTTVQNTGAEPVLLTSVTSWASGLGRDASTSKQLQASDWSLIEGVNDWLGEGRWSTRPLRGALLPELREELTGHTPGQQSPAPPPGRGRPAATCPSPASRPPGSPGCGRSSTTDPGGGRSASTCPIATSRCPGRRTETTNGRCRWNPVTRSRPSRQPWHWGATYQQRSLR